MKGLDWTRDPANSDAAAALLQQRMPQIQPHVVAAVMANLPSPRSGLTPGARFIDEGVDTVLQLRSKFGSGQVPLTDAKRYIDLQYLEAV